MSSLRYKDTGIPCVTVNEMKKIDHFMINAYHVELLQMMENAGTALASLAYQQIGDPVKKKIVILAGRGNNGGGGLVAARRLSNWCANVVVIQPYGQMKDIAGAQMQSVKQLDVRILSYSDPSQLPLICQDLKRADIILDALIGYGLSGNPQGVTKDLIECANQSSTEIISLDVPSGLNSDTGQPGEPCIEANMTLTLALPKEGFLSPCAKSYLGELFLADISVPPSLYKHLGLQVEPFFRGQPYVRLDVNS
jgi:NAD(P)H-hydrate epimerase